MEQDAGKPPFLIWILTIVMLSAGLVLLGCGLAVTFAR